MQLVETINYECPRCGHTRIWKFLIPKRGSEINDNKASCEECDFESIVDHFSRTAEITRLKKEQRSAVKERLERIWFVLKNMEAYDDVYYEEVTEGVYLDRKKVIYLIERHLREIDGK
jgi:predicted RNA-binding Zn-ribbon protein involved in translation (DUF1610 family)